MNTINTGGKMMIDFYLLEALVAFEEYGTLAKSAEHLSVTQPALTHSLTEISIPGSSVERMLVNFMICSLCNY